MVVFVFHFTDEENDEDQCPSPQTDLGLGLLTPTPVLFATTSCSFGPGASKRQDAIKQECMPESLVVPVKKGKPLLLSSLTPLCAELHTGPYIMDSGGLKTEQSLRNRRPLHGRKDLHHGHFGWRYSI